jgi:hypothetical protein
MHNQVKDLRNRLLRRADWRYLLGNPWPQKSVCLSGGLLAQAVQAVSSQSIPADQAIPDECNLVVAVNPDPAALRHAWKVLRPGGSFYSEWYSPLAGSVSRIRKKLLAAGFSNVTCYWAWPIPGLSPALFWLPLEAPQAIRYFLSSRPQPKNLLARIGSNLLLIMWKLGRSTGLLAPICVTASKEESASNTQPSTYPVEDTFANCIDGKSGGLPRRYNYLMWTGGKRSINKVILYPFMKGEQLPHLVIKYPRTPDTVPALAHEAHVLQTLCARRGKAAARVPEVLFFHEASGKAVLGETPMFGRPLYTVLNQGNTSGLALKVTDWLASLAVGEPLHPRAAWWDQRIEPALSDFEQTFRAVLDDSVIPKCRQILNRLGDLPLVFEHRDCSPWNLLITKENELAVLDWESAEPDGLPAVDLAYFLAYLAFFIDGAMKTGNYIESYRRAYDPATSAGCLQIACEKRYIECTGLDQAVLNPLRLLAWLIHTRSEFRHISANIGGSPPADALRNSLFYNLILEELTNDRTHFMAGTL